METLNLNPRRLSIRNLKPKDLTDFHMYRLNPDVTKYQGFDFMTIEQADEFGNADEWIQYGTENQAQENLSATVPLNLTNMTRVLQKLE